MNTSHTMPITSHHLTRRRWRLALGVVVGTTSAVLALSLPAGATSPMPRSSPTGCASKHTVVRGDTWFAMSRAAGVSLTGLLQANDATAETVLRPGAEICLPPSAAAPAAPAASVSTSAAACASQHEVVRGESWSKIAASVGLRTSALLAANGATSTTVLQPGDELCLPAGAAPASNARSCVSKHIVAAGESWYVISRASGVPLDALYAANNAKPSSAIYPEQSLCLPEVGFGSELPGVPLDVAPVRGTCRFANSWDASRGGGRAHVGVDLISPSGTPVVAVANGTLTRRTQGAALSGNAWWLTTSTGTYFFYAHLSSFASGLSVGSRVQAGDVIGYVGATGNAVSPHLHFEIHPNGGEPVNPYSAIWMIGGCDYDRRYEQAPLS
jgi:murein DD-endopeptidase MepM/ murein hydrolase activator NlpD